MVKSKNDVPIRLTEERWFHITEEHSEMAGYYFEVLEAVEEPEAVYEGRAGECIAAREVEKGKYIVVVYREFIRHRLSPPFAPETVSVDMRIKRMT